MKGVLRAFFWQGYVIGYHSTKNPIQAYLIGLGYAFTKFYQRVYACAGCKRQIFSTRTPLNALEIAFEVANELQAELIYINK